MAFAMTSISSSAAPVTQLAPELFSAVLDAGVGGPLALLAQADAALPIVYANAAFVALMGCSPSEITGRELPDLLANQLQIAELSSLRAALESGATFTQELQGERSRSTVWLRVRQHILPNHGTYQLISCEDITQHRVLKQRLRATNARLDVAMAASGVAMWDWNVASDQISYNEHWPKVFGIDPEYLLRQSDQAVRLALPADDLVVLSEFEQHLKFRQDSDFVREYPLRTPSGAAKWVAARIKVVERDANDRALQVIGALTDLTATKENLKLIQETRQSWERAVEGTSDGLFDWDLNTGHVWYAPRFREMLGFALDAFPDTFTAFKNVLHPDDEFLVLAKIRTHLEQRTPLDLRCRLRTRAGAFRWFRLRAEAQRDAAHRPRRLAGSIRDISAQIEAEEALHRNRDFYGTILDALPICIGYLDRDGRVIYANRAFQTLFTHSFSHERVRTLQELLGAHAYKCVRGDIALAMAGQLLEAQFQLSIDGADLDLEASYLPHYNGESSIEGCFMLARDVTERRRLEMELRQSQKMEAIGRLTGGMAHDFNNLLSIIIGNTQLLSRALDETPRLLSYADTVLHAAMRGSELTRRLLTFARGERCELSVVDPSRLLSELHELLKRMLSGAAELELKLDGAVWPIKVDVGQFENAILNLAINARDALPQTGRITLSARQLTVAIDDARAPVPAGEYTVVSVSDTGIGMTEDLLKRVFEPFFTTKEAGRGSGLGLAMVYGFMQQCGGQVTLESGAGQGTCAKLYFPRAFEALGIEVQPEADRDLPRGKEVILVVEDDVGVRLTAVGILSSLGYRVLEAASGPEALEIAESHPEIEMVFSDVMLPGGMMAGAVVRKLRQRIPGLKALLTSGFSDTLIHKRGLLELDLEVLDKPYAMAQLAHRIRTILDQPPVEEELHRAEA
jgi:PAS domain S-box-containing protein